MRPGGSSTKEACSHERGEPPSGLSIAAVDGYLDTLEFLSRKIRDIDEKVGPLADSDRHAKLLMAISGVGHCSAFLISSENHGQP